MAHRDDNQRAQNSLHSKGSQARSSPTFQQLLQCMIRLVPFSYYFLVWMHVIYVTDQHFLIFCKCPDNQTYNKISRFKNHKMYFFIKLDNVIDGFELKLFNQTKIEIILFLREFVDVI